MQQQQLMTLLWAVAVVVGPASAAWIEELPDDDTLVRRVSETLSCVLCPNDDRHQAYASCRLLAFQLSSALVPVLWATFDIETYTVVDCISGQRPFTEMVDGIDWRQVAKLHDHPGTTVNRFESALRNICRALAASLRILNDPVLMRHILHRVLSFTHVKNVSDILKDDGQWAEFSARLSGHLVKHRRIALAPSRICGRPSRSMPLVAPSTSLLSGIP